MEARIEPDHGKNDRRLCPRLELGLERMRNFLTSRGDHALSDHFELVRPTVAINCRASFIHRAICQMGETIERDEQRKTLLVPGAKVDSAYVPPPRQTRKSPPLMQIRAREL